MINKLIENIKKTNAPIVVGLDPMLNISRSIFRRKLFLNWGNIRGSSRSYLAV